MELIHIHIRDFKTFSHFETSFSHGLNVVWGPNEAGKSTIHEAILLGLLDRPTGKQVEQKYRSWGKNQLSEITLTFQTSDGEIIKIRKDYQSQKHEVIGLDGTDSSRSGLESVIEKALGTTSEKLFSSTACIRQDEMMEIDKGGGEISRQLQQIAMGGVSGVEEIIHRLSTKVNELERGWKTNAPRNPGPIRQWKKQVEEIEEQIRRVRPEVERKESAKEALIEQRDRMAILDKELETLDGLYTAYTQRRDLVQALEYVEKVERDLEEKLNKLNRAQKHREQLQKRLENLGDIRRIDEAKEKELRQANDTYKTRAAEVADREAYVSELKMQMERGSKLHYRPIWFPMALLILGVALSFIWVIFQKALNPTFNMVLCITGGILASTGALWLMAIGAIRLRKKQNLRRQLQDARVRHANGVDELAMAQSHRGKILRNYGCDSWESFEKRIEGLHQLRIDLEMAETTLAALLSQGETPSTLLERRKNVSRERRDLQEQLKELAHTPELSPIEIQKLIGAIEKQRIELKGYQEQILKLEVLSETGGATLEDLLCLDERQEAYQHRLEVGLERAEVYRLALDGIRQVRDEVLQNAQHELEPRLGRYLERLTGEKYKKVSVDEDLQLEISEGNGYIGVESLSSGTRDQVYLAARLALCDMIFHDSSPPLLLDDPFVKFDLKRRIAALELCKELASDRQIILFTCHEGYAPYADRVIRLG